jgi:mannose-6-phosphate isomerase-like protein (cupin superfamily)
MIIDLNACPEFIAGDHTRLRELLHRDKGNVAINYSLAHATLAAGKSSTAHRLSTTEVYYILEGAGVMHINEEASPVQPGQAVYIPPHARQYIENVGKADLKFLCIVDPAWRLEDEEVE